jgi:hypothetical protein
MSKDLQFDPATIRELAQILRPMPRLLPPWLLLPRPRPQRPLLRLMQTIPAR